MKTRDKVVCINNIDWRYGTSNISFNGPKKDEIVTITGFSAVGYLKLKEYSKLKEILNGSPSYDPIHFRPLHDSNVEATLNMMKKE